MISRDVSIWIRSCWQQSQPVMRVIHLGDDLPSSIQDFQLGIKCRIGVVYIKPNLNTRFPLKSKHILIVGCIYRPQQRKA